MSGAPGASFPIVLSGPSGSGKTTIVGRLLDRRDDLVFSVSATTRAARAGETDGVDYRFLSSEGFGELIEAGELLEWAEVHGELYGTPSSNLSDAVAADRHLLLDIDVQGARQVRAAVPDAVAIFLLPPSGARIVERLRGRGSEDEPGLRVRMASALEELAAVGEFDYAIVNEDLELALSAVAAVISAEEYSLARPGGGAVEHAARLTGEIADAIG